MKSTTVVVVRTVVALSLGVLVSGACRTRPVVLGASTAPGETRDLSSPIGGGDGGATLPDAGPLRPQTCSPDGKARAIIQATTGNSNPIAPVVWDDYVAFVNSTELSNEPVQVWRISTKTKLYARSQLSLENKRWLGGGRFWYAEPGSQRLTATDFLANDTNYLPYGNPQAKPVAIAVDRDGRVAIGNATGLHVYRYGTDEDDKIVSTRSFAPPALSWLSLDGDEVLFTTFDDDTLGFRSASIATGMETTIAEIAPPKDLRGVWHNAAFVVWNDGRTANVLDRATKAVTQLPALALAVSGEWMCGLNREGYVVDERSGVYNLRTGEHRAIGTMSECALDGNRLVYSEYDADQNGRLYCWDL